MGKICKYQLFAHRGIFTVTMPAKSRILCVKFQNGAPVLYASHSEEQTVPRRFQVCYTGDSAPRDGAYLSTLMLADGSFVLHIFDLGEGVLKYA
jgi:hypothetical protein